MNILSIQFGIALTIVLAALQVKGDDTANNWEFVKCGSYPESATDYDSSSTGKCDGVLSSIVTYNVVDDSAHHNPSEASTNVDGWGKYIECATNKTVDSTDVLDLGTEISGMGPTNDENQMSCSANYGGSTTSSKTPTGGYKGTNDKCYQARRKYACTSGASFEMCGVKAKVEYRDSNQQVQTKIGSEVVPTEVDFKTVACRSMCLRANNVCCDAGFVGRISVGQYSGQCDGKYYSMMYYDSSWSYDHTSFCKDFPVYKYTKVFNRNEGTVTLSTACYDPICENADTADEFCDARQLKSTTTPAKTTAPKDDDDDNNSAPKEDDDDNNSASKDKTSAPKDDDDSSSSAMTFNYGLMVISALLIAAFN